MPRSFDISQYAPNFSPLIDPLFNGGNINLPDMATIIADAIEAFFNDIVQAVDQYTGLDLSVFLPFVDNALTSLATLFGELDPASGTFDPVAALITFFTLVEEEAAALPTIPMAMLADLPALMSGLGGLTSLGGSANSLLSFLNPTSLLAGGGVFGPLLNDLSLGNLGAFTSLFGGLTGGTSILTQLISAGGGTGSSLTDFGDMLNTLAGGLPAIFLGDLTTAESLIEQLPGAGVLTSLTQLPPHLFSAFVPGASQTSLLPDPNFSSAAHFDGSGIWDYSTVTDPSLPASSGSAHTTGTGIAKQLLSVPLPIGNAVDQITVGASAFWQNVVATGQTFLVAVDSYTGLNADGSVAGPPITDPNRIIAAVTNPVANSVGWVPFSGTYLPPAGTAFSVLSLETTSNFMSGDVNMTKLLFDFSPTIDAGLLGNIENIPQLLAESVQGAQGLQDIADTWVHMVDGLGSAASGATQSGLPFSGLFSFVQGISQNASGAIGLATNHAQILGNVTNFPLTAGLDPTAEATFDLQSLPHGSTLPTTTVPTGNSIGGFINLAKDATKGFVEFLASIPSGSSGVYANIFTVDLNTGMRSLVWGSSDIASLIPTSIGWVKALIPGASQPALKASNQLHLELVNSSSNTLTVVSKTQPQPNRPTGIIRNYGATRTAAVVSPSTVADPSFTYSGVTPWMSIGVATVPPNYWPPITQKITTPAGNGQPAGYSAMAVQAPYVTSVTLPSQFRPSIDYVAYIIAPAGGGGDSGTGGAGSSAGDTTVTIDGVAYHAAGTVGANNGGVFDSGAALSVGKGLGNYTYNSQLYQAGGDVGAQAQGSVPGGGGGGGAQFVGFKTAYGEGASKGTWVAGTTQPTNMTISISLGYGGRGQSNYNAGDGADAGVWLYIYQNTAVN